MLNKVFIFIFLFQSCVFRACTIIQPSFIHKAEVGHNVTMECYIPPTVNYNYMVWYKLNSSMGLEFVAKAAKYGGDVSYGRLFENGRFAVLLEFGAFHLNISASQNQDVGIYYCGTVFLKDLAFANGTFLILKGLTSKIKYIIQQPVSESIQPGDSVTLDCSIHTETCAGEHSVYWVKRGAGESHPGIIYTHGDRSGQCEKRPEAGSPTQSCVYNLPKRNLSLSDAGTYYCAVASCGEILFGNGTKINIQENYANLTHSILVLVASNVLSVIVIIVLTYGIYKRSRQKGRMDRPAILDTTQASEVVNYAAVSFVPRSSSPSSSSFRHPRVKANRDTAVYSEVRYLQQE